MTVYQLLGCNFLECEVRCICPVAGVLHGHGDDIAIYIQVDNGIFVEIAALDDVCLAELDIQCVSAVEEKRGQTRGSLT